MGLLTMSGSELQLTEVLSEVLALMRSRAFSGCGSWIEYAADAAAGASLPGWRRRRID